MATSAAASASTAPSALDHELLRELVIDRFGLDLPPRRRIAVGQRLRARLAVRGLSSFVEYYRLVRDLPSTADEIGCLADAVTNPETYFFRGPAQLADLVALAPELARTYRRIRVLSAGCASGEEAYSLAAVLSGRLTVGFEVIGTDISEPRLADARAGRYPVHGLRIDRSPLLPVRFEDHFERDGDAWIAGPELRARVTFRGGNLADSDGLGLGRFEVIFCRNVLIYAHDSGWPRFLASLAAALAPDGHLFLGESETLLGRRSPFVPRRMPNHFAYVHACRSA